MAPMRGVNRNGGLGGMAEADALPCFGPDNDGPGVPFAVIPSIPVSGKCGGISSYFLDLVFCFRESGL
jgi:hypothetical protein